MQVSNVNGNIDPVICNSLESTWKGKIVQILCAGSILLLAYYVVRRCIKTDEPSSQDLPRLNDRVAPEAEIQDSNLSGKIDQMPFQNGAVLDNEIVKEAKESIEQELSSISSSQQNQGCPDLPIEIYDLHVFHFLNARVG